MRWPSCFPPAQSLQVLQNLELIQEQPGQGGKRQRACRGLLLAGNKHAPDPKPSSSSPINHIKRASCWKPTAAAAALPDACTADGSVLRQHAVCDAGFQDRRQGRQRILGLAAAAALQVCK